MNKHDLCGRRDRCKYRYNLNLEHLIGSLHTLKKSKLALICTKYKIEVHQLRLDEFKLILPDKMELKYFKRLVKFRSLYEGLNLVLDTP